MVAAFSCHAVDSYNYFVRSHQPELIDSDARLKAYFVQRDGGRRGEASYHTYKTELANTSSLSSLRSDDFCDRASADFDAADRHANLTGVLDIHRWSIEATYRACHSDEAPMLADASSQAPPFRTEMGTRETREALASEGSLSVHRRDVPAPDQARTSEVKTPGVHRHLEGDLL
jgi:hypothetical protein